MGRRSRRRLVPDRGGELRPGQRQPWGACSAAVDESEPGWRPGDQVLVDLPDGQVVRCRIVNVTEDGTVQVVPEHEVVIG